MRKKVKYAQENIYKTLIRRLKLLFIVSNIVLKKTKITDKLVTKKY